MSTSLFEQASRRKLRFMSAVGLLTTEQLWDLPLQTKAANGASLDAVAKTVNRALNEATEESFVATASPAKTELELKLEIVKYIIADKQAENAAKLEAKAISDRKQALLAALGNSEQKALEALTPEQIKAELAKLG